MRNGVIEDLERQKSIAKQTRFEVNRALACRTCEVTVVDPAAA